MTDGSPDRRLHLLPRHRAQIEALLREHLPDIEVWAYGSRVSGDSHDGSDLDLVLRAPGLDKVPMGPLFDLWDALRESTIPFLVEARDWARLPESFHGEIERDYVVLVEGLREDARAKQTASNPTWQQRNWGELATLEYGKALRNYRNADGPYSVFGTNGPIGLHTDVMSNGPTIIVGRKGAYRGVHYSPEPCWIIDTAFYLKTKKDIDIRWAYYALLNRDINNIDSGSAIPSTSRDDFYALSVAEPPLSEQRAIAHVLGVLDDKIELNRRMNATLEAMARALFKSWFVDFDPVRAKMAGRDPGLPKDIAGLFPDRLVDTKLGEIPESWKPGRLADVAIAPNRSVDPGSLVGDTPYIGLEHMPRGSIALTSWEAVEKVKSNKHIFRKGEILFGKLRPYFHKVGVAPTSGVCSSDIVVVAAKAAEWSGFVLSCLSSVEFVRYTDQNSNGTRMPRTSWRTMGDYRTCLPPARVAGAFQRVMQSVLERITASVRESRNLAVVRDVLLPKLISGDLRVERRDASARCK